MNLGIRRSVCAAMLFAVLTGAMSCTKALNDGQISEQIRVKLNQDSGLQGKSLTVQTSAGVVMLSGTVDNDAQRTAAARYASTIPGIKEVVNNLQVATATTMPASQPIVEPVASSTTTPVATSRLARSHRRTKAPEQNSSAPLESHSANGSSKAEPVAATAEVAANQAEAANAASSQQVPASPPPPPAPKKLTIQSGTSMAVRLIDSIDSETAQVGQTFHATLDSPLSSEWEVAVPAGYNVEGHIVGVKSAGKFAGQSELVLQLDRILVGDKSYNIQTDQYRREGKNRTTNTAEKVGAGAVVGAIIGGIAGGGKGAGIGAAAGAGVGGGVQAATKGQQIKLPSETVLTFTLQSPLTVMQVEKSPEAGRRKLEPAQ